MSHITSPCLPPGVEPDPGAEGRKEPHPAGADAAGGGGAQPLGRPGPRGHPGQRLHTNLPLQAALLLVLVEMGEGRNVTKKKLHLGKFIVLCRERREASDQRDWCTSVSRRPWGC